MQQLSNPEKSSDGRWIDLRVQTEYQRGCAPHNRTMADSAHAGVHPVTFRAASNPSGPVMQLDDLSKAIIEKLQQDGRRVRLFQRRLFQVHALNLEDGIGISHSDAFGVVSTKRGLTPRDLRNRLG